MAAKPTGGKIGRPSQLADPVRATILEAVELGATAKNACLAAGVGYSTYTGWKRQGKADEAEGRQTAFALFLAELRGARAAGLKKRLEAIRKAIEKGDGWLALKFIQSTHPEDYGENRQEIKAARKELAEVKALLLEVKAAGGLVNAPQ